MPAGFKFNFAPEHEIAVEAARFDTCYRLAGGFNLDITNLPKGEFVPSLAPIYVDFATRKAYVVKNVKVVEAAASAATSLKIAKGSFAAVGDKYMVGEALVTVSAIDKTNENYDVLTVSALGANVALGAVLPEGKSVNEEVVAVHTANFLNYAWTKVEDGATVTAIGKIFEIDRNKLVVPISNADVANLGDRFLFLN